MERLENGVERLGQVEKGLVLDAAPVDLMGSSSSTSDQSFRVGSTPDPNMSLDHLHGGATGGGGSSLLPSAVSTGGRAPLRDQSSTPGVAGPPHQPQVVAAARRPPASGVMVRPA
jgi:hypothetical protein